MQQQNKMCRPYQTCIIAGTNKEKSYYYLLIAYCHQILDIFSNFRHQAVPLSSTA
jgi:hypothetical protein